MTEIELSSERQLASLSTNNEENRRRRPVSIEGLEAGQMVRDAASVTDETVLRVGRICKDIKTGNYFGFAYGIAMILAIGATLIFERRKPCPDSFICVPCDTPLPAWAFVLLLSQLVLLPMRGILQRSIPTVTSITTPTEAVERLNRLTSSVWYNATRIFRVFSSCWFIVGMVWIKQSNKCDASKLYYLCFVLIVLFLVVAGFFLLYTVIFLAYGFISRSLGSRAPIPSFSNSVPRPGLSEKAIEKLPSKRYHPGSIPVDDAICAICLAEYVPGEKIRSLENCCHHFHATCIGQWLSSKKTCPLCNAAAIKAKTRRLKERRKKVTDDGHEEQHSDAAGRGRRASSSSSPLTLTLDYNNSSSNHQGSSNTNNHNSSSSSSILNARPLNVLNNSNNNHNNNNNNNQEPLQIQVVDVPSLGSATIITIPNAEEKIFDPRPINNINNSNTAYCYNHNRPCVSAPSSFSSVSSVSSLSSSSTTSSSSSRRCSDADITIVVETVEEEGDDDDADPDDNEDDNNNENAHQHRCCLQRPQLQQDQASISSSLNNVSGGRRIDEQEQSDPHGMC